MTTSRTNWTRCLRRTAAAVAIPLLAMGLLLASARIAWAYCRTGCFTNNFYRYNDGSLNDYAVDATVCLTIVRSGNIDRNTYCTNNQYCLTALVSYATRFCSQSGQRGENDTDGYVHMSYLVQQPLACAY